MIRLKNYLNVKGITMKGCADLLGISEKSMYNKLVAATDYSYGESRKLKTILPEYDIDYLLAVDPNAPDVPAPTA